jgi:hypothetical protein
MATTAEEFGGNLWGERMADLAERREREYQDYLRKVEAAKGSLDRDLKALDREHELLVGLKDDPLVLVRKTAGGPVTVYHSVDRPCGRVTGSGIRWTSFVKKLEGEAKKERLKRCTACRW